MRGPFAHRDFRLLLLGQGTSTIGDRIVFVALALPLPIALGPTAAAASR